MSGKTCKKCGVHYADISANFPARKENVDGFSGTCRQCKLAQDRASSRARWEDTKRRAADRQRANGIPERKQCRSCGFEYADVPANFHRHATRGFHPDCKECRRVVAKARYAASVDENREANRRRYRENKAAIDEQNRQWRANNREQYIEAGRRYYAENRDKIRRRQKRSRDANPGPDRDRSKEWRRRNPGRVRELNRKHRGIRRGAEGSHTEADVRWRYEVQKGRCYWCRKRVGDRYHVDHVIPISKGGRDSRENIVVACPECNLSKKAKMPSEFAGVLL